MKHIIFTAIVTLALISCKGGGGNSDSDSSSGTITTKTDVNVAASKNGATATSAYNSATASNIIDEDLNTTWISEPGTPLVVKFKAIEEIKKFTIKKVDEGSLSVGA